MNSVLKHLFGVERCVIEDWEFDEVDGSLTVRVRLPKSERGRCSVCCRRCPRYDQGDGPRRWRSLDLGTTRAWIEADMPRVKCQVHGVLAQAVPWARAHSGFTRDFENQCSWLSVNTNRTAVSSLLRIAWRTVGRILGRVSSEAAANVDLLDDLWSIGIDELSHKKGHKYVIVIINQDTGRLVWMAPGRDKEALGYFFDKLGPERCAQLKFVSADGADWIEQVVKERAPQATRCLDPFHVVQWATNALDEVRRAKWNELRTTGAGERAHELKGARWALWKNPADLSPAQEATLAWLSKSNSGLYRAYLLKEGLRSVFHQPTAAAGKKRLKGWLSWASRSRLRPFSKLAKSVRACRERIEAALETGLTNARVESKNNQLRLMLRQAFGFHHVEAFIGLAMLKHGGLCPPLPGRT